MVRRSRVRGRGRVRDGDNASGLGPLRIPAIAADTTEEGIDVDPGRHVVLERETGHPAVLVLGPQQELVVRGRRLARGPVRHPAARPGGARAQPHGPQLPQARGRVRALAVDARRDAVRGRAQLHALRAELAAVQRLLDGAVAAGPGDGESVGRRVQLRRRHDE